MYNLLELLHYVNDKTGGQQRVYLGFTVAFNSLLHLLYFFINAFCSLLLVLMEMASLLPAMIRWKFWSWCREGAHISSEERELEVRVERDMVDKKTLMKLPHLALDLIYYIRKKK